MHRLLSEFTRTVRLEASIAGRMVVVVGPSQAGLVRARSRCSCRSTVAARRWRQTAIQRPSSFRCHSWTRMASSIRQTSRRPGPAAGRSETRSLERQLARKASRVRQPLLPAPRPKCRRFGVLSAAFLRAAAHLHGVSRHVDASAAAARPARLDTSRWTHSRNGRAALDDFIEGRYRILLATDAASEGLNLHSKCRVVINLELPWNPMRLEQRIGRIDRIGQSRTVACVPFDLERHRRRTDPESPEATSPTGTAGHRSRRPDGVR